MCVPTHLIEPPLTNVVVTRNIAVEVSDINKPYSYVLILKDPLSEKMRYEVVEPTLFEDEKRIYMIIQDYIVETIDVLISEIGSEEEIKKYISKKVREIVEKFQIAVNKQTLNKLLYFFIREYTGYGKIDAMMQDSMVEDISCNGVNIPIYIWHRKYESIQSNVVFTSDTELDHFIVRLAYRAGRMISVANPTLDGTLTDGSRINMTLGKEITKHGSTFTIRKFRADPLTIIDMINYNTVSSEMAAFFWFFIENKYNIFVCGPTASGKTTLLNTYSTFIEPDNKILTIEDTPEIRLYHKNWIRSVSRPLVGSYYAISLFDLLKAAMRQRPDYIIVGEIRGEEASTLFQALATGHGGMSTLHADSAPAVIHRLETEPMNIPRSLLPMLNIVTIQERITIEGKPVRRTISVTEIIGVDPQSNDVLTNEVFTYDTVSDTFKYTGRSYLLEKIASSQGKLMKDIRADLNTRTRILDWMAKNRIRSFEEVTDILSKYYLNPDEILKKIRVGK